MAEKPLEHLTLREKFTDAERLARELIEHLEQGFVPKAQSLIELVRPARSGTPAADVEDTTVRNTVSRVLETESFTNEVYAKLERYAKAIETEAGRVVSGQ